MALGAYRYDPQKGDRKDCSKRRKAVKRERQMIRQLPSMYNRGVIISLYFLQK